MTDGRMEGFSRLVLDPKGRTVTAGMLVGPRAGETLAEVTLAVRQGMSVTDLASPIHPYPAWARRTG